MIARLPRGTVAAFLAAIALWAILSLIEPGPVPSPFGRGGNGGEMPTWLLGAISVTLMVAVATSPEFVAGKRDGSGAERARIPAPGWYWPMMVGAQLICLVFALPAVLSGPGTH
ncbi:hypothetical protein [Leucobacter sp. M11]|uniref:hypothetical protein n=1 Tax=Leucobacter sp. M11 TaxID=2993565 RepID=UPI002D7F7131|nr:hypothetical protein [Leucobacter sp. M11]MEB4613217.1 hypothetical protein [Leucobacter sp. M11]